VRGVNVMRAHSVVEKFCRELKKKRLTRKNSLNKQTNNHFFPLAKTSSRVVLLLLLTSHIY